MELWPRSCPKTKQISGAPACFKLSRKAPSKAAWIYIYLYRYVLHEQEVNRELLLAFILTKRGSCCTGQRQK
eukprot:1159361-Pelagomonas_calceolata.AAC.5